MEVQIYETETPRLVFRRLRATDVALIAPILQDEQTMRSWEHAFSYDELCDWLADNVHRYRTDGCGCWAAFKRDSNELVALAGPVMTIPARDADPCPSLIYIVRRDLWVKGYGTECAKAVIDYSFSHLDAQRVSALVRTNNIPALRIAASCGLRPVEKVRKTLGENEVTYLLCILTREKYLEKQEKAAKKEEALKSKPEGNKTEE